jgi:hypothetical protein
MYPEISGDTGKSPSVGITATLQNCSEQHEHLLGHFLVDLQFNTPMLALPTLYY